MDEERLEKDLDAIEAEKKEYLQNHSDVSEKDSGIDSSSVSEDSKTNSGHMPEEDSEEEYEETEEDMETEETEFSLTEDEINEWINELTRLKEDKEFILLEIDEENTLKINYQDSGEDEDDSEEENEEEDEE